MFIRFVYFVPVKVTHALACLTSGKTYMKPTAGWMVTPERGGFLVLWLAVRAKLWLIRSLVQVNTVLGYDKPQGQSIVFLGVFFFCLPFFKVFTRFLSFCFLLIL